MKVTMMTGMLCIGLGQGVQPLLGYCVGAKNWTRYRQALRFSLALALGLSDVIQSSAGGVRLDTMFVDEGFGSLDSEALNKAYLTLAGLTQGNRLVGVISHVAELKEKIDRQIVVKKDRTGQSRASIVAG